MTLTPNHCFRTTFLAFPIHYLSSLIMNHRQWRFFAASRNSLVGATRQAAPRAGAAPPNCAACGRPPACRRPQFRAQGDSQSDLCDQPNRSPLPKKFSLEVFRRVQRRDRVICRVGQATHVNSRHVHHILINDHRAKVDIGSIEVLQDDGGKARLVPVWNTKQIQRSIAPRNLMVDGIVA